MDVTSLLGSAATCASVASFFPQAVKVAKTRDTSGISAKMYAITVAGFTMWTAYGVMLPSYPLIVANGLCLLVSGFILGVKLLGSKARMLRQADSAV